MKNLVKYTLFALVAVTLTGCIASDFEDGTLCRDGVLTFDLSTGDTRNGTSNDGVGDGTNDDRPTTESVIKDIQFFLYKRSADDTPSLETDYAIFAGKIIDISAEQPDTYKTPDKSISIPAQTITQLFEDASKCDIYVIVNYIDHVGTDLTTDLTKTSRQKLKSLPLTFKFNDNKYLANTSFVMDSELMTVSRGTESNINKLTADDIIYVTRAAAKILIEVNVENSITVNGETWEPYTQSQNADANDKIMTLSFFNGVKYGIIDDDSDTNPDGKDIKNSTANSPYYSIENMQMQQVGVGSDITNPNTSAVTRATTAFTPMSLLYTYTSLWDDEDSDVPYFMLTIPWRKASDSSATWVNYEYKIPISKTNQFVRNKLYLIRLTVGALGDLNLLDESVLSFSVLDWKSQDVNVSLDNPRYLVVNEHSYEMDNVEEILIPYSSSHECIITDVTCKRDDVLNGTEASLEDWGEAFTYSLVEIEGKTYIKFTNDLDNNLFNSNGSFNDNFDFGKYTISLTISHKNADGTASTEYTEDVKIIQYPAIYGERKVNSDYANDSSHYGYAFVNGENDGTDPSYSQFCGIAGSPSGSGVNSNSMYVVTVSSVKGTNYVIGDPRTRTPLLPKTRDGGNFTYVSAPTTYTTTNQSLTNYYSAQRDLTLGANHPTYNMVAPKFRICSGYGAIDSSQANRQYLQNVEGRCATYQEDGYPAGRWRLPTRAELELIYTLCEEGKLPDLFADIPYWCAHGYGSYNSGSFIPTASDNRGSSSISVRCVYDEWYWGSEPIADKTKFTWGDEPRPTATAK